MPSVKVQMYATIREAAGVPEISVEASDLEDLLAGLKKLFGRPFARVIADGESVVILVNGRNESPRPGVRTRLKAGDEVSIFPPVSGG